MKRRTFLSDTLKASLAGTLLSSSIFSGCIEDEDELELIAKYGLPTIPAEKTSLKVCIVGSGVSGLFAAKLLKSKGINPTIFEAGSKTGGRFLSITKPKSAVIFESGASALKNDNGYFRNEREETTLSDFPYAPIVFEYVYNGKIYSHDAAKSAEELKNFLSVRNKIESQKYC